MIDFLLQPWPWYFSGPMIAFVLFLLLWTGKTFGMSSNLRTLCAALGAGKKVPFFNLTGKRNAGISRCLRRCCGRIYCRKLSKCFNRCGHFRKYHRTIKQHGIQDAGQAYMPASLFSLEAFSSPNHS